MYMYMDSVFLMYMYMYICLAELHNVQDSVAPRSYVDSQSQAFSDSWAWPQG